MLKEALKLHTTNFINILKDFLSGVKVENSGEKRLLDAISYSLINSNAKYIRSFLVIETAKMLGFNTTEDVKKLAIATEMIHCYSLIHDDLPAMDNSNFRRGVDACHIKFGESTAIMAGNAIQVMAFDVLSSISKPEIALKLIKEMANVCGLKGILGGQVIDLSPKLKEEEFDEMNYKKTGVLIEFCLNSVAILFETKEHVSNLKMYGKNLGIAYQMQDDILDEGESEYSYINHFKTRDLLKKSLKERLKTCEEAIVGFNFNFTLLDLLKFLEKRTY
jgi:geranylgeranyl pyrophosphate synthase